jgi:hypothetical protein
LPGFELDRARRDIEPEFPGSAIIIFHQVRPPDFAACSRNGKRSPLNAAVLNQRQRTAGRPAVERNTNMYSPLGADLSRSDAILGDLDFFEPFE